MNQNKKVLIASDHAGFDLKKALSARLEKEGYLVEDLGTYDREPVDYPDFSEKVGLAVRRGDAERGILICGSGVGASVAVNKIAGIRASVCHDAYSAHQGVEHDDMNVLVLGARVIGVELAYDLVSEFLNARFSGESRHVRRLAKVKAMEDRFCNEK